MRSDGSTVDDSRCDAGTRPAADETAPNYQTCTHQWRHADYLDPGKSCTDSETQIRAVWCARDLDQTIGEDSACDASTRPQSTQQVADYSGCTFEYLPGEWTDWSSHCSTDAVRKRQVDCRRSDGTLTQPAGSGCEIAGQSLPVSEERAGVYDSCGYVWKQKTTQPPVPACGASTQPLETWCERSDGTHVDDEMCKTNRPPSSVPVTDVTACFDGVVTASSFSYGLGNGYVYAYQGIQQAGAGYSGNAGIAGNGSAFGFPQSRNGGEVGFLQTGRSERSLITMEVTGLRAGSTYELHMEMAGRPHYGVNTVTVSFEGTTLGTYTPDSVSAFNEITTPRFVAAGSTGTITLSGPGLPDVDVATGIDGVRAVIVRTP